MKDELPKIVVDERGFLRVKLPSGEMLPEVSLIIENSIPEKNEPNGPNICSVTVTFIAEHELK